MLAILVSCAMLVVFMVLFNAVVGRLAGVDDKGDLSKVAESCAAVMLVLVAASAVLGAGLPAAGIPFLDAIEQLGYAGVLDLFRNDVGRFALECANLISLMFVIGLVSRVIPSPDSGFGLGMLRMLIIVGIALAFNAYLFSLAQQTPLFGLLVAMLRSTVAGVALLVTPAMLLGHLLGTKSDGGFVSLFLKELPKTAIGKAFASAFANSVVLVGAVMLIESQLGSLTTMMEGLPGIMNAVAILVMMVVGYRIMIKSMFK